MKMEPFNSKRFAGSSPANLIYVCVNCGNRASHKVAHIGCPVCATRLFRVARYKNLIDSPIEPYRSQEDYVSDNTEGYKLNDPGTAGQMGGSALGPDRDAGFKMPKDGAEGEEIGTPNATSDSFLPENSPLRPVNQHENSVAGPHNMQAGGAWDSTGTIQSLFDRIRNERKRR